MPISTKGCRKGLGNISPLTCFSISAASRCRVVESKIEGTSCLVPVAPLVTSKNILSPVSQPICFHVLQFVKQVVHALRQAFCDQSDGRARVEAVASLLLSEHHLAEKTADEPAAAAAATAAAKDFLDTREAFCLGADVSAHVYPQSRRKSSRGMAALLSAESNRSSTRERRSSAPLSRDSDRPQMEVSVGSVLRELDEKNQKRKRRLLRRRRQRRRRRDEQVGRSSSRHRQRRSSGDGDFYDEDNCYDGEYPQAGQDDEDDEVELRNASGDGRSRSPRNKPRTGPYSQGGHERWVSTSVSGPRLALAASVSTLTGLLGRSSADPGERDRLLPPSCERPGAVYSGGDLELFRPSYQKPHATFEYCTAACLVYRVIPATNLLSSFLTTSPIALNTKKICA